MGAAVGRSQPDMYSLRLRWQTAVEARCDVHVREAAARWLCLAMVVFSKTFNRLANASFGNALSGHAPCNVYNCFRGSHNVGESRHSVWLLSTSLRLRTPTRRLVLFLSNTQCTTHTH